MSLINILKTIFLSLFILIGTISLAQEGSSDGYYISYEADTVFGKYNTWYVEFYLPYQKSLK